MYAWIYQVIYCYSIGLLIYDIVENSSVGNRALLEGCVYAKVISQLVWKAE